MKLNSATPREYFESPRKFNPAVFLVHFWIEENAILRDSDLTNVNVIEYSQPVQYQTSYSSRFCLQINGKVQFWSGLANISWFYPILASEEDFCTNVCL